MKNYIRYFCERLFKLKLVCLIIAWLGGGNVVFAQQQEHRWEWAIAKFEKQDSLKQPPVGANLFVGSSSFARWRGMADYFPGYTVINRGFGGSQFVDALYFADRLFKPYKPAKIFIYEGDNDLTAGKSPEKVLNDARALREVIAKQLPGVPVVFVSAKPSVARWHLKEKYETFNKGLEQYARNTKNTEYADVWNPALDEHGMVYHHIFVNDSLHMNPDGYKIWQKALLPFLAK